MSQKVKVWRISDEVIFVAIQPPLEKENLERIQIVILKHINEIGRFAIAGKIGQRKGISYFRISTSSPWPRFEEEVELGLEKALQGMSPDQKRRNN